MGTDDDDERATFQSEPKPEVQEQEFPSSDQLSDEDALIHKMENVVLKSDENLHSSANSDGHEDDGGQERSRVLPLRPYAGDCPHYVRTGTCKFGLSCRYNHPVKRTQQSGNIRDSDSNNSGTIECKYYSTEGGCKYGKSCRYLHPGEDSGNAVCQFNFLGLPIRQGEQECPYYMRNGSCGYGSRCIYHHPDPSSIVGLGSMEKKLGSQAASVSGNGNYDYLNSSGASQPARTFWSSNKLSDNNGPYSENRSLYESLPSSNHWMTEQSEPNGYQASSHSRHSRNSYSSPISNDSVRKTDFSMQVDEFPERPGQPECDYYMKTGNCKFRSTCRFHHPKNRVPKQEECVLSENGLPLRPGRSICRHYERLGLCKFGSACLFDHPVSYRLPTSPEWQSAPRAVEGRVGEGREY